MVPKAIISLYELQQISCNVQFIVFSSLGPSATTVLSPMNSLPICSFLIGHFAEGDSEHYVGLRSAPVWQENYRKETALQSDILPTPNNVTKEPSQPLVDSSNINEEAAGENTHMQINEPTSRPPLQGEAGAVNNNDIHTYLPSYLPTYRHTCFIATPYKGFSVTKLNNYHARMSICE